MKRPVWKITLFLVCVLAAAVFFNMESTTKQGINYGVKSISIPLYLKTLDFIDRDLNYRWTVRKIINGRMSEGQKAEAIFQWTIQNISRQPDELPIIDDHVWHIIVRGYGVADQLTDVFATLCNYSGLKAFILVIKDHGISSYPFGAVYIDGAWHMCDLWRSTEFVNREGRWATVNEIISGNWSKKTGFQRTEDPAFSYNGYFQSLKEIDFDRLYEGSRPSIQNPMDRLIQMFHSKERTTAKEKS